MDSDLFCTFHPNRVMVPSFVLRFGIPLIPTAARSEGRRVLTMVES